MTDEIDSSVEREQAVCDLHVNEARVKAALIPKGEPGDCDLCGEWSGRLVSGVCAPCRDKHHI